MVYIQSSASQNWLLPPSLLDLIPKDHVCFLVESFVDSQDFSSFDIRYAGAGHPAYHPRVILKLLVMGVLDRVRSSRRLSRNACENIVYMYLSEKLAPDFRTISDFRKNNPELIKDLFVHTVTLAKTEGFLDLSVLATDGTKLKANAANRNVLSKAELAFLLQFIDVEFEEWNKKDFDEEHFFKNLRGSDELPNSSKKKMQKAVKHYMCQLQEKGADFKDGLKSKLEFANSELEKNDLKKVNLTDPESRFMPSKKGKIEFSYNPQITTEKNGFILANDVCNQATDNNQLQPQVIQTKNNLIELPKNTKWCFDAGYYGGENIHFLNEQKIDAYLVGHKEESNKAYTKDQFKYYAEKDEYICPEGQKLKFQKIEFDKTKNKFLKIYKGVNCKKCTKNNLCTKSKSGIRRIKDYPYRTERERMTKKMKTKKAKEIYKLRKQIVEFPFGDLKENKGILNFLTRSLETVKTEFNLISIANNLSKIMKQRIKREKQEMINMLNTMSLCFKIRTAN